MPPHASNLNTSRQSIDMVFKTTLQEGEKRVENGFTARESTNLNELCKALQHPGEQLPGVRKHKSLQHCRLHCSMLAPNLGAKPADAAFTQSANEYKQSAAAATAGQDCLLSLISCAASICTSICTVNMSNKPQHAGII